MTDKDKVTILINVIKSSSLSGQLKIELIEFVEKTVIGPCNNRN